MTIYGVTHTGRVEKVTAEMQREVDELQAWLHSPEGEAWVDQQLREADEMALDFQRACAAGEYALSPAEIEQLLAEGRLVMSPHKKGDRT